MSFRNAVLRFFLMAAIGGTCLGHAVSTDNDASVRRVSSLNEGWWFHLGAQPEAARPNFDHGAWRQVNVPHDYVVEGQYTKEDPVVRNDPQRADWHWLHGFLPAPPAVYRKVLIVPEYERGRRLWLEFDGVFSNSRYWLNGIEIGSQYSGYTRSRFDITDAARVGEENILVVEVNPQFDGWWYEGGGIYRQVRMISVAPTHVAPDGVFVAPEVSDPQGADAQDAVIAVSTDLVNRGDGPDTIKLLHEIVDAEGSVRASKSATHTLAAGAILKTRHSIILPEARLWAPSNPYRYRMETTVTQGAKTVDRLSTYFGVRHVRFDANHGLYLNGQKLKIQGVNMHQDHAGVGVAMPDRLFTWRLERLKEMGCNAIRMSHNPVTPYLLDECDRLGFLVIAENRHLGDTYADQASSETVAVDHKDLTALVLRDRNHPSIILWSLCNEQWIQGTAEAAAMIKAMADHVRTLDPTRPITAAMNGGFDSVTGMGGVLDVIGINYNPHVYDQVHELFPSTPIVASEIASEVGTRGVYTMIPWESYLGDPEKGYVPAYSVTAGPAGQTVEKAWPPVAEREFVAGGFVWAAFDYRGEPRPFRWPVINCHYGFMDLCGLPKDSYFYYKAAWSAEPVLHLFPHWNWEGKEGQEISVWVHSNCDEIELFLNGVSMGKKTVKALRHLEWRVPYSKGRLTARATRAGKTYEIVRETTGKPAALRLSADRPNIISDGADLAVITVEVVDKEGRVVHTAGEKVHFSLSGPGRVIGVGNGDPSSHESDKGMARTTFNGLAQAIVQAMRIEGKISLTASAEGLEPSTLILRSEAR